MVTKTKKQNAIGQRRKVKVNELKLNKETVSDLAANDQKRIKGGYAWGQRPGPGGPVNSGVMSCECPHTALPDCYSGRNPC